MFGVLLSNELNKAALENPQQITPPGGYAKPKPITPGTGTQPAPVTPSDFNPGYNKMASQESTMNMFGVLVNMELQKLAAGNAEELPSLNTLKPFTPSKGPDLATDVNAALNKARAAKKQPKQ